MTRYRRAAIATAWPFACVAALGVVLVLSGLQLRRDLKVISDQAATITAQRDIIMTLQAAHPEAVRPCRQGMTLQPGETCHTRLEMRVPLPGRSL